MKRYRSSDQDVSRNIQTVGQSEMFDEAKNQRESRGVPGPRSERYKNIDDKIHEAHGMLLAKWPLEFCIISAVVLAD